MRVRGRRIGTAVFAALMAIGTTAAPAGAGANSRPPGPLRVLLVGDSITVNYEDEAAAMLRAKGYQVTVRGLGGWGMRDRSSCKGQYARALEQLRPDVVVVQSSGNYGMYPRCNRTEFATPTWFNQWRTEATRTQRILSRKGARFHWLLTPMVSASMKQVVVPMTNAIYESVATEPVIDAWSDFGGWTYDAALHSDSIHLNQAGAERMADLVVETVG
jgi:lysophospholipase L1-like esterase